MNERIRELSRLAKIATHDELIEENYDPLSSSWPFYWNERYANKLSILIVKECAGIYEKIDNGNDHMGTEDYLLALQKHFGVK